VCGLPLVAVVIINFFIAAILERFQLDDNEKQPQQQAELTTALLQTEELARRQGFNAADGMFAQNDGLFVLTAAQMCRAAS
jgi:hypothetical protein